MSDFLLDPTPKAWTRAKRFPLHLPVRYRKPHSPTWFDGRTVNISYSGVLFSAQYPLQPKTRVELRFELPVAPLGEAPAKVVGKGVVVRVEESPISGIPPALAVSVGRYRMSRGVTNS
jgi:hypothetical protein